MDAQVIAFVRTLVTGIIHPYVVKLVSTEIAREERFLVNYLLSACFGFAVYMAFGQELSLLFWWVLLMGFFSAFASYFYWRAADISLSKASLFTWGDDVISIALALLILNEHQAITAEVGIGISTCILAVLGFSLFEWKRVRAHDTKRQKIPILFLWVLGFCVIWGVTSFLIKPVMDTGIDMGQFIFAWYLGALPAAAALMYRKQGILRGLKKLSAKDYGLVMALVVINGVALMLHASSLMWGLLISVQPMYMVAEIVLPVFVGLYFFREYRELNVMQMICLVIGFLGLGVVVTGL